VLRKALPRRLTPHLENFKKISVVVKPSQF